MVLPVIIVEGMTVVVIAAVVATGATVTLAIAVAAGRDGLEFYGVWWLMEIYIDFHC